MPKGRILIADPDPALLHDLRDFLTACGYSIVTARDSKRALEVCSGEGADVVLMATELIRGHGVEMIAGMRKNARETSIILMSDFEEDIGAGRFNCENLVKPFSHREIQLILKLVFCNKGLAAENALLTKRKALHEELLSIVGKGKHLDELVSAVSRAAENNFPVVIYGEKGTGRDAVARVVHSSDLHNSGPFIFVPCGLFTEEQLSRELFGGSSGKNGMFSPERMKGKVELADGGTLYLDGVECIPPSVQIKLIHLIAERGFERPGGAEWVPVDVRVMLGTSSALEAMVDSQGFRADLYYRVRENVIALRPLRECRDAIPWMVGKYLDENCSDGDAPTAVSEETMKLLCEYDWPGNHFEFESSMAFAVSRAAGGKVLPVHLPPTIMEGTELGEIISNALDEVEKRHISMVLEKCSWNKHETARELEISKSTLYSKINKYRLQRPSGRRTCETRK